MRPAAAAAYTTARIPAIYRGYDGVVPNTES